MMVSKFNKQVWAALACALFGINNVKAEGSEIMNHRIVFKGGANLPFTKYDDTFKELTGIDKKADNFKIGGGAGFEYDYFINPYFGIGFEVVGGYQRLSKYNFGKAAEDNNQSPDGKKSDENKNEVAFGGFYLNPSLVLASNFLGDGFTFDEEEGCAAGLKLGLNVKLGANLNFSKVDYGKIEELKDKKENQAQLPTFGFAAEPALYCELPLGLGLEIGFRMGLLSDILTVEKDEGKNGGAENKTKDEANKSKVGSFSYGLNANLYYNFANLLY